MIVYLIKCGTCLGLQQVHAAQRWRLVGDPKRTLYRSEAEALAARQAQGEEGP